MGLCARDFFSVSLSRATALVAAALGSLFVHATAAAGDRPDIYSFNAAARADLYTQMSNYITGAVIQQHLGPPADKHGSSRFAPWHRVYIKGMEDYLIAQNRPQFVPLPKWNPNTPIPAEFFQGGAAVDPDCPPVCSPLVNSTPGVPLPASLSTNLCTQTPYTTFRSTLESSFHNGVHGAIGGVMGTYKSPGAPIFWLWHAFVDDVWYDWQCACGLDEGNAFDPYTADEKNVDLDAGTADAWMKDSDDDIANEPNNETGAVLWQSKDIWVRNSPATPVGANRYTNEHQHQNPEYSPIPANTPYIYVKLRNRGCEPISGDLHVYWANASTGLTWPTDFNEVATSPVAFVNVAAGRDHVAEFHWLDIPEPTQALGDHFCLVARFVASPTNADPINGEQNNVNVYGNVKNSNQIAWKNLTIVDNVQNIASVLIRNNGTDDFVSLTFTVPDEHADDSFFDHGTLIVDLADLFPIWLAGGAQGHGIEVTRLGLQVFGPDASIDNLRIQPGVAEYLINLMFHDTTPPCEDDTTEFTVHMNMLGGGALLGGNTYRVIPGVIRRSPPVVVIAKDPPIDCGQGTVTLISVATPPPGEDVVAWQWFVDGSPIAGAVEDQYTAQATGAYSILVTYSNGCDRLSASVPVFIGSPPENDDACNARMIALDVPQPYDIYCATPQPGEVSPGPGSGPLDGCNSQDGWCASDAEVQNSVWFAFQAPATGAVSIGVGHHDHVNGQLAVWRVADCAAFDTFALVAANDDAQEHGVWGTDPALDLGGLEPGGAYYIQLDGFQGWQGTGTITVAVARPPCPQDLDGDGVVGFSDLLNVLSNWGPCAACPADLDGSGDVGFSDLLEILSNWGPC